MVDKVSGSKLYNLKPLNSIFGAVVEGLDMTKPELISAETKQHIIDDVHKHRLLLFRNDGSHISAEA